jgi:outer membrane protein
LKNLILLAPILGLGAALVASAQSNGKVAVMNVQAAMIGTKDGQKAIAGLQQQFGPRKAELEKRQTEIAQLQDQLNKAATDDDRARLTREVDQKTKSFNREREDAAAEVDQAEQKIMSELGGKIVALSQKYAKEHGYTWIVDIGSPRTPVVYYSEAINITKDVIDLYDKGGYTPPSGTAPAAKPVVPAPRPAAPPK